MDPVSIIMGLAQFVPTLVRWAKGDKAGAMADKALAVAQAVTGQSDANAALDALQKDPALALQFQQQANQLVIAELDAENKQIEAINTTMRTEAMSGDKYVARWRPTYGYAVTFTWTLQMIVFSFILIYAVVAAPDNATTIINAVVAMISAFSMMWGVALSVLGVYVSKRSQDKQVSASQTPPPGLLGAVAQRIAGGGNGG